MPPIRFLGTPLCLIANPSPDPRSGIPDPRLKRFLWPPFSLIAYPRSQITHQSSSNLAAWATWNDQWIRWLQLGKLPCHNKPTCNVLSPELQETNKDMDILNVLDDLHKLAVEEPKTFMGLTWGLDKDEVDMQIVKIRSMLPDEVKAASATMRESDRIMETARQDAFTTIENAKRESDRILSEARQQGERIVEQSRLQQERMISESEVLKLAKAQSEEMRNAADRDAVQMRRGAEKYAVDVLTQLESVVGKVMTTIERGKQDLKTPDPIQGNQIVREKVRA